MCTRVGELWRIAVRFVRVTDSREEYTDEVDGDESSMPNEYEDNAPVTTAVLIRVLDERLSALRAEMIERIEDTETRLLKEFRKWAVRIEAVGRVNETRSIGLDQRIAVIEERLNDLEDRPRG